MRTECQLPLPLRLNAGPYGDFMDDVRDRASTTLIRTVRLCQLYGGRSKSCNSKLYLQRDFPLWSTSCSWRIQNEGKIANGRRVCCSCAKSVAAIYGPPCRHKFHKMVLLCPTEKLRSQSNYYHSHVYVTYRH